MKFISYLFVFSVALGQAVAEEDWPSFRGPKALGVSDNANLPIEWSDKKNVEWKAAVAGLGWSGPVVHSGRVYLTTAVSDGEFEKRKPGLYFGGERREPIKHMHHFLVLCLELATGEFLWQKEVLAAQPLTPIHVKNSYAAETPVTDGERVYAYFGSHGLYCLDMTGKVIWGKMFKPYK
ncbi:MAG: outer membrane protein assembly factor BamB, partial [Limisphaerales bacterium]